MTTWNSLRPSRRHFLTGAAAFGLATSTNLLNIQAAGAAEAPKRGGTLRLGIGGGSTTASLDPRSYTDIVTITLGAQFFSSFVEFDSEHQIQPALIESWDVKSGATEWVLTARKGVTFHNGKTVTLDDLIYSLNLHRGNSTSGVVGQTKHIKEIKKIGDRQIGITLSRGDSELINLLGDFHFKVVPDGFTDWSKPIGSGPFVFESYVPGVSAKGNRFADYWATDRAFVDAVETTVINDTPARTNALIAGQVDIINRADKRTVDLLKQASNVTLETGPTGWHAIIAAKTDTAPFNNADLRLALKYAIDREEFLKTLLNGYGTVGNDHPIRPGDPFYNNELPQTRYDADKAKFYLKKANLGNISLQLSASEAAFEGAVNAAELYQASAAKAGLNISILREPVDGFWSNVWLKRPFTQSYWQGRSTALQMLTAPYKSDSPWNETAWRNASFDKLLTDAAAEIDAAKRKSYVWEAQRLLHEDGGAIIPIFQDELEAHGNQIKGYRVGGIDSLFNGRIAEYVWIDS